MYITCELLAQNRELWRSSPGGITRRHVWTKCSLWPACSYASQLSLYRSVSFALSLSLSLSLSFSIALSHFSLSLSHMHTCVWLFFIPSPQWSSHLTMLCHLFLSSVHSILKEQPERENHSCVSVLRRECAVLVSSGTLHECVCVCVYVTFK